MRRRNALFDRLIHLQFRKLFVHISPVSEQLVTLAPTWNWKAVEKFLLSHTFCCHSCTKVLSSRLREVGGWGRKWCLVTRSFKLDPIMQIGVATRLVSIQSEICAPKMAIESQGNYRIFNILLLNLASKRQCALYFLLQSGIRSLGGVAPRDWVRNDATSEEGWFDRANEQ